MQRIKTLTGTGKLRTADAALGTVRYSLDVWREPNGWKQANGSLVGADAIVMQAFFAKQPLLLDLQTGGHVSIIITGGSGEFQVSGPVPGV